MEKIGEFARRCDVTIKTLRYYDQLGLLVPDHIDPFAGYRYYGPDKVAEMSRITELKDNGFSLEEIKRFCSADSDDKKQRILWEKRQTLEKLAADTTRQIRGLSAIEQKFIFNKKEERIMNNRIDFNSPFENDEAVIGRWEIIDVVGSKEALSPGEKISESDSIFKEIYFLPDGQEYWVFSWTKDYVKMSSGDGKMLCRYELEEIDCKTYMFVYYREEIWVLEQTDKKRYAKNEIGRLDNIDLPFVHDENVLGKWEVVSFVREIDDFTPAYQSHVNNLIYKSVEFLPEGILSCNINGAFKAKWTKRTTLRRVDTKGIAEAYEIRDFRGTEYLFVEWKSGDYIWGNMNPCYYVFKRTE